MLMADDGEPALQCQCNRQETVASRNMERTTAAIAKASGANMQPVQRIESVFSASRHCRLE